VHFNMMEVTMMPFTDIKYSHIDAFCYLFSVGKNTRSKFCSSDMCPVYYDKCFKETVNTGLM